MPSNRLSFNYTNESSLEPALSPMRNPDSGSFRPLSTNNSSSTPSGMRRTTNQAQNNRSLNISFKLKRNLSYRISTIMCQALKHNKLPGYTCALQVVKNVNSIFGKNEYVTSREILKAVNEGRINEDPPRQGTVGRFPQDAFLKMCDIFFTHAALSQDGGEKLLVQNEYISALSIIIDPYFNKRNEESMAAKYLYERIRVENALQQNSELPDHRELIRFKWFTQMNLQKHYVNWEKFIVERGYARDATGEETEKERMHVKWHEQQKHRAFNKDEMGFSLSGSSNGVGGRTATTQTTDKVQYLGEPVEKSSSK